MLVWGTYNYSYSYLCIDKSMQIVLERGSIDNPLTFNIGLLQLIFHTSVIIIATYVYIFLSCVCFYCTAVYCLFFYLYLFSYFSKLLKLRFLTHSTLHSLILLNSEAKIF